MPHGDKPPQYLRRLAGPVFIPLGGVSIYAAWRAQCLSRLAGPVFSSLTGPVFSSLTGPVLSPLGTCWFLLKERRLDAGGAYGR